MNITYELTDAEIRAAIAEWIARTCNAPAEHIEVTIDVGNRSVGYGLSERMEPAVRVSAKVKP